MRKMNLLFSMNAGYIPIFANCFRSILRSGGADAYSVYILHSDLEEEHQERIRQLDPSSDFHFVRVDPSVFEGFPTSPRYPLQIYYRLAAPMLLPDTVDRILYLDGDIVVINSLEELYNTDFEGNYLAACTHTGNALNMVNQVRLGMDKPVPYINSGVMLYNLPALRDHLSLKDIQEYARKHDLLLFLPDQDILTALYGDKIKVMDARKYNLGEKVILQNNLDPTRENISLDWIRQNTSIIHYFGKSKPWKENYTGILDVFYEELIHHKNLYVLESDSPAVLEQAALELSGRLDACVRLNGSWAWMSDPLIDTVLTRQMVTTNLVYLLHQFIFHDDYHSIVFYWQPPEQQMMENVLARLNLRYVKMIRCFLGTPGSRKLSDQTVVLDRQEKPVSQIVQELLEMEK